MSKALKKVDSTTTQINIAEGLQDFGIEIDLTAEELFETAIQAFSTSLYMAVKGGMAFMAAQEGLRLRLSESGEGETFKSWINKNKLTEQRVYEVIKIAKGYLAIPAAQRKGYLALGKYKALKLASIEPEALAELAEKDPEALGAMALMSRQEMACKIANLGAQLEIEQSKNSRLLQSQQKTRLTTFAPLTEDIRAECMVLQLEAELPMKSLHKLFEDNFQQDGRESDPEWLLRIEQMWVTAHIVAAGALDMLQKIKFAGTLMVNRLPDHVLGTHILTESEAEEWLLSKATIENAYGARQAVRQAERDEAKPRGRGRPAKEKTKGSK